MKRYDAIAIIFLVVAVFLIITNPKEIPKDAIKSDYDLVDDVSKDSSWIIEIDKASVCDLYQTDYYLNKVSDEAIRNAINHFYCKYYRRGNMRRGSSLYDGKEVNYDVYYAGQGDLWVEFINHQDESLSSYRAFSISSFGEVKKQKSEKNRLQMVNYPEQYYLCSGAFTFSSTFDEFDEKDKVKKALEKCIWYRYFDFSEEKQGSEYPIFHESTKAMKILLLDFDDKSSEYDMLVFTENGYVYDVTMEYLQGEKRYQVYELADAKASIDQIAGRYQEDNDELISYFKGYYHNALDHVISTITSEGVIEE